MAVTNFPELNFYDEHAVWLAFSDLSILKVACIFVPTTSLIGFQFFKREMLLSL